MNLKKNLVNIIVIILLLALVVAVVVLNDKVGKLKNQLAYTTDNTSVILSEVSSMQDNIRATLEEEASMIASFKVTLASTDFTNGTYTVDIEIIPKEYTQGTDTKIYFGTEEYMLSLSGFKYVGQAVLPLSEGYDGNVTVLFVEGNRRYTEVVSSYKSVLSAFDVVKTGMLLENPSYADGKLKLDSNVDVAIDGDGIFNFASAQIVVEANGQELAAYDVIEPIEGETVGKIKQTVELDEELELDEALVLAETLDIRIYLRATASEGYIFAYDLFAGTVNEEGDGFVESEDYNAPNLMIYDSAGGSYKVEADTTE